MYLVLLHSSNDLQHLMENAVNSKREFHFPQVTKTQNTFF